MRNCYQLVLDPLAVGSFVGTTTVHLQRSQRSAEEVRGLDGSEPHRDEPSKSSVLLCTFTAQIR